MLTERKDGVCRKRDESYQIDPDGFGDGCMTCDFTSFTRNREEGVNE